MNVLGLITEYNPFHNGHKHHLLESKRKSGATHTIVIMSGNFLQRGEPALTNKWIRAEMAVKEGVDLVIELPVVYACNSAESFAFGGISLLNNLNIVDSICFGSESGDLENLRKISEILVTEPVEYKNYLKAFLSEGFSFPKAREKAICRYCSDEDLHSVLHSPNNILGVEYIKSLLKLKSSIKPLTVNRIKADYHSTDLKNNICSATAIRKYIFENPHLNDITNVMPKLSFDVLKKSITNGFAPIFYSDFDPLVLYKIRTTSKDALKKIIDVNEGLENRIKEASLKATTIKELRSLSKSKRYTQTRLQRIFIHSLLGITKEDLHTFNKQNGSQYARVLAFSSKGTELLKKLKKTSEIPVLTNINKQTLSNKEALKMLSFDILATDIYSLAYPNVQHKIGGHDYYNKPFSLL